MADELDDLLGQLSSKRDSSSSSGGPPSLPPPPPPSEPEVSVKVTKTTTVEASIKPDQASLSVSPSGKSAGADVRPAADSAEVDELDRITKSIEAKLTAPSADDDSVGNLVKTCATCRAVIKGDLLTAKNKHYHPEHFTCVDCGKQIGTSPFYDQNGYHCRDCYRRNYMPKCNSCSQPIEGTATVALGKKFHPEHFSCSQCGKTLSGSFYEKEGRAYCDRDYDAVFGLKCTKCHGLIQGQATSALNQKFHPRCFTCASCGTELGSTFFERDGNAYCKDHAQESAGICARCGGNIYGKSISAANRKWHPEHFTCTNCNVGIAGPYREVEEKPYCTSCAERLFKR